MNERKLKIKKSFAVILISLMLLPTAMFSIKAMDHDTNPYSGGWSNCVWAAWQIAHDRLGICMPRFGNAGGWVGAAQGYSSLGYTVGSVPRANSIAVWTGHVGFVAAVEGNNIYVMEGGYLGGYHEGWYVANGPTHDGQGFVGYVYLDGVDPSVTPTGFDGNLGGSNPESAAARKILLEKMRGEKKNLEEQIAQTEADLKATQVRIGELKDTLNQRSRSLYEMGPQSIWEVLFSGKGSFIDNFEQAVKILDNDFEMMREYNKSLIELNGKITELFEQREELKKVNVD